MTGAAVVGSGRRGARLEKAIVVVVGLALGTSLLWLSVPRMMAGFAMIPGDQIKARYIGPLLGGGAKGPTARELQVWRQSRIDALAWVELPDAWGDLSLIEILEARNAEDATQARTHHEAAREAVRSALSLNPASGFWWLRLAMLDVALGAPVDQVLASVGNSIRMAPYEPAALYVRIALVFRHWDEADPKLRETILEQVTMLVPAMRWDDIKRLARLFPQRAPYLREHLGMSERALKEIDEGLAPEG